VPSNWCSVGYYEYGQKVGETFANVPNSSEVFVDGGLDPDPAGGDRFCIGTLTNLERTEGAERCRHFIGNGIRLTLKGEGDVWMTVLNKCVFVQSLHLDVQSKRLEPNLPHKFVKFTTLKVFDLRQCYTELCSLAASRRTSGASTQPASCSSSEMDVDRMSRMCSVRVSFLKGFGPGYPKRGKIEETPCWVEIRVNRALQILDEVLNSVLRV